MQIEILVELMKKQFLYIKIWNMLQNGTNVEVDEVKVGG